MENKNTNILQSIDAYVKGRLSEEEIEKLWYEIAKDPSLLETLEIEVGVKELLREEAVVYGMAASEPVAYTKSVGITEGAGKLNAPQSKKKKMHKMPGWSWYAYAAAVVILVAAIQFFKVPNKINMNDFIVQDISIEHFEFADALRSDRTYLSTPDSLLSVGFEAVHSEDLKTAFSIFSRVAEEFDMEPYGSKAYLNMGIIQYNSGKYSEAVSSFENAAKRGHETQMIAEKAYWFLANAYIMVGEREKALYATGQAYSQNGIFQDKAYILYQKLSYDLGKVDFEDFDEQMKEIIRP